MAVVVVIVLVARTIGIPGVADLRRLTSGAGSWAPLAFVGLQALLTVAPVPRTIFTVTAGLLFGSALGLGLTLLATALAAVLAFVVVRVTGGRLVQRYVRGPAIEWTRRRLDHNGALAVASLRLVPALPFAPLNYLCGLSTVRFAPYLLGTVAGILPGTVAMVVLGDAVTGRPSPAMLAVSATGALVGLAGIVVAARRPLPDLDPPPGQAGAEGAVAIGSGSATQP